MCSSETNAFFELANNELWLKMNRYIFTRISSISLGIAAYLCVPVYYTIGLFDPPDVEGYVCGLYMLGPLFVAGMSVLMLSSVGTGLGFYFYKKSRCQKNWKRSLELLAILFPAIFAIVITASIFLA